MARKVLLVDDEEGIRKVLSISLEDSGYQVFSAKSGEEALELFKEIQPPIVLTDIKMPGMDGIQLLRKIKKDAPDTEVIMITGHGDMGLAIQSLKFDATDFITKPINDEALEIALKRANESIYLRRQLKEYTENLERLVEEKTKQLLAAERLAAVGQTVAGLAHTIKNIATGLTGGGFVLEKGIELNQRQYLINGWQMIKGNVERIKRMALDLLNFAKEREPDYQLCDPNAPLNEVFQLMLPRSQEYGVELQLKPDDQLPKMWLDPEAIQSCILDLTTNAIDACIDFNCVSGTRQVLLRSRQSEGWAVEYQVVDNGCGMDDETKARIFQNFFSTKGSQGTGLGLMITKKIVDEHGGAITFKSEKGKGTTFIIKLPLRAGPTEEVRENES